VAEGRTKGTSAPAIWRGRTVEAALRLDATALIRAGRRRYAELWARWEAVGDAALLPVAAPLTRGGVPAGEAPVTLALHGPRAAAELPNGTAALIVLPTNLLGLRWWWRCPQLGHVCAALFLPPGAGAFLSRQAYGLRYRSLSANPMERAACKARKLRAKLGEHRAVLGGPLPDRPLRLHTATYERLCGAIREAEERALVHLVGLAGRHRAMP
jgi:hypothetical protein